MLEDTDAALLATLPAVDDSGGQSCLLNLSFDLAVDKLLRLT